MKKILLRSLLVIAVIVLVWTVHFAWVSFPIISGFDAKQVCTCIFVSGRTKASIDTAEMSEYPFNLAKYEISMQDSSVTASVFGFAKRKAIYRKGIGCTLINDLTEAQVRSQVFSIPPPIAINPDSVLFPLGDKINDTIPPGIDITKLNAAVNAAFTESVPNKKQRTRAVLVVYDGKLVAEKYASGFTKNTRMYGWSMAKSLGSALIGTLVQQGKLDIKQPAPVPEWSNANDPRHAITIEDLLHQMSGLDFLEDYTEASDVTNMLYKKGDMAAFAADHSLAHQPGAVFNYSSGNSNILSGIIRQTVGGKNYAAYPFSALFYKIGMYNSLFEPDASGTYVNSSYINATARDYTRFGLLYYHDGVWNGERILPEDWVHQTVTSPSSNKLKNYGYQFWLNGINSHNPTKREFPDVPADMFYCDGFADQGIFIIPSKKLVIVRLGLTLDKSFDTNAFLKSIIEAVQTQK
jgi:CubicO group peptidase (beta-lactamase class C family)